MPTNVDLADRARGDLWRYKFVFTDAAGDPIDITNWVIWFTLKMDPTAADPGDLQASHVAGTGPNDDESNGLCYLVVPESDTKGLTPGNFNYDFQYVIPGTDPLEVHTISYGKEKVVIDITVATSM